MGQGGELRISYYYVADEKEGLLREISGMPELEVKPHAVGVALGNTPVTDAPKHGRAVEESVATATEDRLEENLSHEEHKLRGGYDEEEDHTVKEKIAHWFSKLFCVLLVWRWD